ncbi:MAG: superfamily II RNA helicase, partial [Candidatus Woesearchaeota archaeon]
LPAIFFSFSRALCESRALELSKKRPFTTDDQRKEIITLYRKTVPENTRVMLSAKKLHTILTKGIGVHHAGMLPKLKEIVELLFDKGLIQVLYATETFAVGINMPAKTVCFGSLEKYDGISFRLVNSKEYFQLAGRAGRRGIDTVGHSISIIDRNKTDQLDKIKKLTSKDSEPIQSQYNLSYNTVLNLIRNHTQKEIEIILKSNFGYFVKKEDQGTVRIIQSFHNYSRILEKYGFLENKQLTWKGEFATRIYTKEMEITEIVYDKMLEQFTEIEILSLVAGLVYEPRRMDTFELKGVNIDNIFKTITTHKFLARRVKKTYIQRMASVVEPWATGCEFEDLLKICSLAEGDIIRLFRLLMDMLRQIKGSLMSIDPYNPTIEKITNCIKRIDRDIISVEL